MEKDFNTINREAMYRDAVKRSEGYIETVESIMSCLKNNPYELMYYKDFISMVKQWQDDKNTYPPRAWKWHPFHHPSHKYNLEFTPMVRQAIKHYVSIAVMDDDYEICDKFTKVLFQSLLLSAKEYFDYYLQAVEFGKPLDKQFYLPRRHYLKRYVDEFQKIKDGELDFLSVSMPKRTGKAVTLDTLIPTPMGFKCMGDIKVGDIVMAKDGYDTKVTDVFPQGKVPVYEVEFDSGYKVKTCANHLWTVKVHDWNKHNGGYYTTTLSTGDMMKTGLKSSGKNSHNIYSVEYCEPAEFLFKEVELDPYVLGALLGDGCLRERTISLVSFDHETTDYIKDHLPEGDMLYCQDETKGRWIIKSKERKFDEHGYPLPSRTVEILEKMGCMDKLAWDKDIPSDYIFTTSVMRQDLLQGLLDTDGYCTDNHIEYSTTSEKMAKQVAFIVRSLGGKASVKSRMGSYKKDGKVINTRVNYRVHIQFPSTIESPFKIERKKNRYKPKRDKLYHRIVSITPCGEEEAQCICVDNDEHLFLIGTYFVPTHNSQNGINFVNWISGLFPDGSTLMEGTGTALVNSFYKGLLEYLDPKSEYHYYDIFPERRIVERSAELMTFNFDHKSRFPTVMCRSIDQTQVGLSEATNLLYLDDCVDGRVEARNRELLDKKWEVISADVIGRAIEGTPIVICGTRYSIYDPIGRLQDEMRKQGKRISIIEIPALDLKTDESNFAYMREGAMVFTTQYFRNQRMMISAEQFESEFQQMPFEAKGLLFKKDDLMYFDDFPEGEPDAIVVQCDTADKGSDSCVQIAARLYGTEVYIDDVICDNSPPSITKPRCAKQIMDCKVQDAEYESNNAGEYFGKDVQKIVNDHNYVCSFKFKRTISNKQTRIEFASDNIIKHFHFRRWENFNPQDDYALYLRELTTYTRTGKVPHDDAPDCTAMLENRLRTLLWPKPTVMKRPF